MALIRCLECGKDVSDQAATCPNCGAPVDSASAPVAPNSVGYSDGQFVGTTAQLMELAKSAVAHCNYRVDAADAISGTVTFTTGMTMGSWSGVSGTISWQEVEPYHFVISGQGKQNVRGGQMVALNLFDEANAKARNVIEQMMRSAGAEHNDAAPSSSTPSSGCLVLLVAFAGTTLALGWDLVA